MYPAYLLIIENPIDLGAMQKKATADAYRSRREFLADVRQMVWNAKLYNCKVCTPALALNNPEADVTLTDAPTLCRMPTIGN